MKTKWLVLLVIAFFCVTGCSSMSRRAKCASVGAATGAAVGATAGLIIGHNVAERNANLVGGGIIGGVAGALIGGVTGYLVCEDDPEPAPAVEEVVEVVEVEEVVVVPEKIILNGVQFDFDKAIIKEEYTPVLDVAVMALQGRGDKVEIIGYTDSTGPEDYNMKLSERRAKAVKAYLVDKGIDEVRLIAIGAGESNPIADNTTREGRQMNRRAELVVVD